MTQELLAAAKGKPNTWAKDLPELLEWVADRRDRDAERDGSVECVAPVLREHAAALRAAIRKSEPR